MLLSVSASMRSIPLSEPAPISASSSSSSSSAAACTPAISSALISASSSSSSSGAAAAAASTSTGYRLLPDVDNNMLGAYMSLTDIARSKRVSRTWEACAPHKFRTHVQSRSLPTMYPDELTLMKDVVHSNMTWDAFFRHTVGYFNNLESLDCGLMDPRLLRGLCASPDMQFPSMRTLRLRTSDGAVVSSMRKKCPSLSHLSLDIHASRVIGEAMVKGISAGPLHLAALTLSESAGFDEAGEAEFTRAAHTGAFRSLKALTLDRCRWITPTVFDVVAAASDLTDFTQRSCDNPDLLRGIAKFTHLLALDLSFGEVNAAALSAIAIGCQHLNSLKLSDCTNLVGAEFRFPLLTYLNLINVPGLTEARLRSILHGCPKLTKLCLGSLVFYDNPMAPSIYTLRAEFPNVDICYN